jgi:hypothetical protein
MRTNRFHPGRRAGRRQFGWLLLVLASPAAATSFAGAPAEQPRSSPAPDPARQLAQAYGPQPYYAQGPRGRPVMDHDHARQSARSGENRSFDELLRSAQARGRGEYLGVEPDISRNIYRFKFMRAGGNVVWVDVDGRSARVLSERE